MSLAGGEHRMLFSETTPGFSEKAEDLSDERREEFRKPQTNTLLLSRLHYLK
jgi:hypothetical protein